MTAKQNRQMKTPKHSTPSSAPTRATLDVTLDPTMSHGEAIRCLRKRTWGFFEDFPLTEVEKKLLRLERIELIEAAYMALAPAIHPQFFEEMKRQERLRVPLSQRIRELAA